PSKIENKAATLRARATASQDVQPVYSVISLRNEELMERIFTKLEVVNADTQLSENDKIAILKSELPLIQEEFFNTFIHNNRDAYKESLLEEIRRQLSEFIYRIPEET